MWSHVGKVAEHKESIDLIPDSFDLANSTKPLQKEAIYISEGVRGIILGMYIVCSFFLILKNFEISLI